MAPKTEKNPDEGVVALIYLIMSAKEFQPDLNAVGALLGLASGGKNVPRKINNIINPLGYEFKAGKIVSKDDGGNEADAASAPTTLKSRPPKTPKKTNGDKTPASKKRKIASLTAEKDEAIDTAEEEAVKKEEEGGDDGIAQEV